MYLAQFRTWFDAQIVHQHPPCPLVCVQRLGPLTGTGQRPHERDVQILPKRILRGELADHGYQLLVVAEAEFGLDAPFDGLHAQLFQPR